MSTSLAIALVMAMHIIALAPLALAYWKPGLIAPLLWLLGVPLLGIATYQAGPLFGERRLDVPSGQNRPDNASAGRCGQIITLLEREKIILDRSAPERLVVAEGIWTQLPEPVRDAVVSCVQDQRPTGAGYDPVEVVLQ